MGFLGGGGGVCGGPVGVWRPYGLSGEEGCWGGVYGGVGALWGSYRMPLGPLGALWGPAAPPSSPCSPPPLPGAAWGGHGGAGGGGGAQHEDERGLPVLQRGRVWGRQHEHL